MVVNLSRQCLILIPVIIMMDFFFKLDGFLLAQPVAGLATTVLAVSLVLPGMLKLYRQGVAGGARPERRGRLPPPKAH